MWIQAIKIVAFGHKKMDWMLCNNVSIVHIERFIRMNEWLGHWYIEIEKLLVHHRDVRKLVSILCIEYCI